MEPKSQQGVNSPPLKPWERAGTSSGPAPFKPPSPGSTSDVVEASGTAKPGEVVSNADGNATVHRNSLGRPVPTRPWQQNYGSSYGGYGSGTYGGSGMYGGGMHNGGYGGPMGGYGVGMGGPYGGQDPNNPFGAPPSPPGFWISFLRVMQGVVTCFGRISILIDQNTQAFHMFMTALLQLFDRSGMLYGELARFVLRLLGIRTKPRKVHPPGSEGLQGPHHPHGGQNYIEGPKSAPAGSWDNVWTDDASK
ncbi:peroxisomal membrane protein 13-like isoform X7 [Telopea speciosissima]|uniref:peroxisomal membrane protein 13-like isoform X7 n=1 Tax=Telopea speciosissima TaxID=54955 RepID=UPI001CC428C0|nr:peroxisomal membrane protein 13-like isoform X7 [Telopea speciosissima]